MPNYYSFEKLEVWKDSRQLVKWIYQITACLPSEEKFGLVNQIRRAAISVVSNLAEGSARMCSKDQAYFYQLSFSSLIEILTQLIIASDLNFIAPGTLHDGRELINKIANKISAVRKSQLK